MIQNIIKGPPTKDDLVKTALYYCREGRNSAELRQLYKIPLREQVPWGLFPSWARPCDEVEGPHEG